MEHLKKRKAETKQVAGVSGKKPKGSDVTSKSQPGQSHYRKCGMPHEGACRARSLGCDKCGKTGHFCRDYTIPTPIVQTSDLICFHCNQRGHKKANYP